MLGDFLRVRAGVLVLLPISKQRVCSRLICRAFMPSDDEYVKLCDRPRVSSQNWCGILQCSTTVVVKIVEHAVVVETAMKRHPQVRVGISEQSSRCCVEPPLKYDGVRLLLAWKRRMNRQEEC